MPSQKKPAKTTAKAKRARGTEVAREDTARLRGPEAKTDDELSEDDLDGVAGGVRTDGAKVFTPSRTQRGPLEGS